MLRAREVAGLVAAVDLDRVVRGRRLEVVAPVDAAGVPVARVREAAGIDDQRAAGRPVREAEEVVVAVAALPPGSAGVGHRLAAGALGGDEIGAAPGTGGPLRGARAPRPA